MLTVGARFPEFRLTAVMGPGAREECVDVSLAEHTGKWKCIFSWPYDFSVVCPTEIQAFARSHEDFVDRDTVVLGFSVDSVWVHRAWRAATPELRDVPFPFVSDGRRELSTALGILHAQEGVALRATFLVDPTDTIRWACCYDLHVGRNVDEVLRTLSALQSGGLCRCGWHAGEGFLEP